MNSSGTDLLTTLKHRLGLDGVFFATPWPAYVAITLLVVAALWFGFNYWRDGTRPSWWVKGPLVLLRIIALLSLVAMLAQPTRRLSHVNRIKPNIVVVMDNSDSMTVKDARLPSTRAAYEAAGTGLSPNDVLSMTRLERANAALNRAEIIKKLSANYNVRVYSFATRPHSIPLPADATKQRAYKFNVGPDAKEGDSTQMGAAIRRPLEDLGGQPIAGILLLSDGGHNLGEDPLPVADQARTARIPVSTVGIGDPTKTKDVALLSVLADDVVRVNNTVTVYAELAQRGYAGKSITVSLLRDGLPFQSQSVRLAPDDQKQEIHFTYVPTHAGRFYYTVAAAVQPGEITAANNKRAFVQNVIDKKLRVLYIESDPRYEFRYLKNAIPRDTSLDFGCILLSADDADTGGEGNIKVKGFPDDEKSLFEYDIVVLGDVPRSYFSDAQLVALRRFVEDRGASLLVIAGEQHMPHEYAGTPLEAILPVVITPSPDPVITDEPFQWQLTAEGRRNPIMQLEDEPAENAHVWQTLPGMFWAAGVPRAKPGATVLAVHPTRRNADGPYPLVAAQPFGAGKCYLELVDSTWRWRWRVGDRYFYRYWGQVFRTLTPKELPGNSRFVQINADRSNYRLGEKVTLSARLLDAYYHPIKVPSVTTTVLGEGGQSQRVTLQATPGSPGLYTVQFQPDRVGKFSVTLTSPVDPLAKASTAFLVESLALERQRPELDENLLKKVAAAGGGKYYRLDQLADWMHTLHNNGLSVHSESEIELFDDSRFLIVFITALGLEWLVRKRRGLL
jgi:hypothetical protein